MRIYVTIIANVHNLWLKTSHCGKVDKFHDVERI